MQAFSLVHVEHFPHAAGERVSEANLGFSKVSFADQSPAPPCRECDSPDPSMNCSVSIFDVWFMEWIQDCWLLVVDGETD
ncbi:MAG: hypothetical protein PVF83_12560 [Anaerolineales bacterium]|jgi:hypothetical protein